MMNVFLLYIDPGTGSMLFTLFVGLAAAATFALRALYLKAVFFLTAGRIDKSKSSSNVPFLIFSDHKRYWNVFHGLCDEFEKNKVELTYYTASPDDPVFEQNYKYVHAEYLGEGNKPYAKMNMVHADIVIATTPGLDVYQWKRSRYVKWYVHIPHTVRSLYCYRMFGIDHYDSVLTTGVSQNETALRIEELRPTIQKKEYVIVGSPTMDNIKFKKDEFDRSSANVTKKKKTVVVAPSWGKSGILAKFGEKFLDGISKTDYEVIIRPHPQTVVSEQDVLHPLEEKFKNLEWNYDNDNFSVLNRADVLISDFSGTMFDFALGFDKPIVYTDVEFDTAPYDSAWLPEKMWEFRTLPRLGNKLEEKDFENINAILDSVIESDILQKNRDEVRSECWEHIGSSSKNCFDYLVNKHGELI